MVGGGVIPPPTAVSVWCRLPRLHRGFHPCPDRRRRLAAPLVAELLERAARATSTWISMRSSSGPAEPLLVAARSSMGLRAPCYRSPSSHRETGLRDTGVHPGLIREKAVQLGFGGWIMIGKLIQVVGQVVVEVAVVGRSVPAIPLPGPAVGVEQGTMRRDAPFLAQLGRHEVPQQVVDGDGVAVAAAARQQRPRRQVIQQIVRFRRPRGRPGLTTAWRWRQPASARPP